MDARPDAAHRDLLIAGLGHVVVDGSPGSPCDPTPFLRVRKNRKFMGVQDDLAVVAAGRALAAAGLGSGSLGERAGLYLAVGYIPFEKADIDRLLEGSFDERGAFSMALFTTRGYGAVNPLLTFRCLSNMPAFHISVNTDLQGPYIVTYPGPGQLYLALEAAVRALAGGEVDVALVAGVNGLERAAGCVVIETEAHARARTAPAARARLADLAVSYRAHDPIEEPATGSDPPLGPAALPVALSLAAEAGETTFRHEVHARDGIDATSTWEIARA